MLTQDAIAARAAQCAPGLGLRGPWQRLGGLVNVVHRAGARAAASVIVKHAPPHLASAPAIPLSPARLGFEHAALRALAPGGALAGVLGPRVRAPVPLGFDPAASVLVLEDFGDPPDLAAALPARPPLAGVLDDLGAALGRLHRRSAGRPELAAAFDNRDVQQTRLHVQYEQVGAWLEAAGVPEAATLGERALGLGRSLLAPGRCLVMGDLWPASVLDLSADGLALIDWEFAHYGRPLQDVAHLAAHLWMQAHRAPSRAAAHVFAHALTSFLTGYAGELDGAPLVFPISELCDAAVHVGCEILARTVGPFRTGFLYDGLPPGHPARLEALASAVEQLRAPPDGGLLAPLAAALGRTACAGGPP
jgi:hypothetical protein